MMWEHLCDATLFGYLNYEIFIMSFGISIIFSIFVCIELLLRSVTGLFPAFTTLHQL